MPPDQDTPGSRPLPARIRVAGNWDAPARASRTTFTTPHVGRSAELAVFRDWLAGAAKGNGGMQIVAGAHVSMTVPNFYRLEHSLASVPFYQTFLTTKVELGPGWLKLSGKPGLGHDLDLDEVGAAIADEWRAQGGTAPRKRR